MLKMFRKPVAREVDPNYCGPKDRLEDYKKAVADGVEESKRLTAVLREKLAQDIKEDCGAPIQQEFSF